MGSENITLDEFASIGGLLKEDAGNKPAIELFHCLVAGGADGADYIQTVADISRATVTGNKYETVSQPDPNRKSSHDVGRNATTSEYGSNANGDPNPYVTKTPRSLVDYYDIKNGVDGQRQPHLDFLHPRIGNQYAADMGANRGRHGKVLELAEGTFTEISKTQADNYSQGQSRY